jgi:hypothetical protein
MFRRPRLEAVLVSWLRPWDDVAGASIEVGDVALDPDAATGAGLDQIGGILDLGRGTALDPEYRSALRARGRAYRSQGRTFDLLDVAELSAPGVTWTLLETPPASATIWALGVAPEELPGLAGNLGLATGNAITLVIVVGLPGSPTALWSSGAWSTGTWGHAIEV